MTGGNEFRQMAGKIDHGSLREKVKGLREPCYESELMRFALPDVNILLSTPLELFRAHFVLFHSLFRLQEELAGEGRYLHIHFMRIWCLPFPPDGECRFFEDSANSFCRLPAVQGARLCPVHSRGRDPGVLETLSDRAFYLEERNFGLLDEETAAAFLKGGWTLLRHGNEIGSCFSELGIPPTGDLLAVKRAFRKKAGELHPDSPTGDAEKFLRLDRAYRILLGVIPTLSALRPAKSPK